MAQRNKKHILKWCLAGGVIALIGVSVTSAVLVFQQINSNKAFFNELDNFVNENLNNYEKDKEQINNEFVKGVDVSSYCEVIENFLFQKNIKKVDGTFYKYNEIFSNYYEGKTLDEYINENFFSYFDDQGNKKYANLFEILKFYGINSIRIRVWNNPYDSEGNPYGGGTNDIDKTLWLIKESKKYGINDFKIVYHYSDFWADPGTQCRPKEWENLNDDQLIAALYDFTYESANKIINLMDDKTKITFQIGNEVNKGILRRRREGFFINNNNDLNVSLLNKGIEAIANIRREKNNNNIKIGVGFGNEVVESGKKSISWMNDVFANKELDTIYLSFYYFWGSKWRFENLYKILKELCEMYPNKEITIGEISFAYNDDVSPLVNEDTINATNSKNKNWSYTPAEQIKLMYDAMNVVSKTLPHIKTGFYYYEPANMMIGKNSWTNKHGLKYYEYEKAIDTSEWTDINNWSRIGFFDTNATALPILDVIKQFERVVDVNDFDVFETSQIIDNFISYDSIDKLINKKSNFIFQKNFNKINLNDVFVKIFGNTKIFDGTTNNRNINIYKYEYDKNNQDIKKTLIEKIVYLYNNVMYEQVEFVNYNYNSGTKTGSIEIKALDNSFYYKNSVSITFNVYDEYFDDFIDLRNWNSPIEIEENDINWTKKIVEQLKKQPNWQFENDIYKYLKVDGGAKDDNDVWLYDKVKSVDRFAGMFLLNDSKIRHKDNTVNIDLLNENKIWVDTLGQKYKKGETVSVNFAIRKEIIGLDKYNDSTFSQVGLESWMYVDLLIYKVTIKIK